MPLVLIPAFKPDERMVTLCGRLREAGFAVLAVDDGSGPAYRPVFDQAHSLGCQVVRHAVNLGKGRALKTGINAALNLFPDLPGLITADADGQHTAGDIQKIADAMRAHPDSLVTGARSVGKEMPLKSRAGNALTRLVYRFVSGVKCKDTQTGLRGIPARALPALLTIPGERYEYEMMMLLRLGDLDLPLHEVDIETIYIDDNKGSHFHPLRDGLRIYSVIFKFLLSSVLSFGLDYALYLFFRMLLRLEPWLCYALARALSSLFNYTLNRMAVFGGRGGHTSILRYYLVAASQMAAGAGLVQLLHSVGFDAGWVKIPVDIVLFFLSYTLQRDFVFGSRWRQKKGR